MTATQPRDRTTAAVADIVDDIGELVDPYRTTLNHADTAEPFIMARTLISVTEIRTELCDSLDLLQAAIDAAGNKRGVIR